MSLVNPFGPQLTPHPQALATASVRPQVTPSSNSAATVPETVDFNARRAPQQLLNQQVLAALNERLQASGAAKVETLGADDFAPEKVAQRILWFIGSSINQARSRGADAGELEAMREQAREGVARGFDEAAEMLQALGVFAGKIKADAERTHDLLQQGLDELGGPVQATTLPAASLSTPGEAALMASRQEQGRSLSLQLRTRDGDRISLSIESLRTASQSVRVNRSEDGLVVFSEHRTAARDSLQFSVEGQLDADELKAVTDFIGRVDRLADRFFDGDVQKAFQQAGKLKFDSDELAGFSLSLNQFETRQATLAYRSVDRIGAGRPALPPDSAQTLAPLSDFLQQFAGLFAQARDSEQFAEPDRLVTDLLSQRLALDSRFEALFGKDAVKGQQRLLQAVDQLAKTAQAMRGAPEPDAEADTDA